MSPSKKAGKKIVQLTLPRYDVSKPPPGFPIWIKTVLSSNRANRLLRKAFTLQNIRDAWGETCESLRSPQRKTEFSPEVVRKLLANDPLPDWGANHERVDAAFEAEALAESLFPPAKPLDLLSYAAIVRKMQDARPDESLDRNIGDSVVRYLVQRRIKRAGNDPLVVNTLREDEKRLLGESKQYWKAQSSGEKA